MARRKVDTTTAEPENRELTAEQLHKFYTAAPSNIQEAVKELLTEWVFTSRYAISAEKTYLYVFKNEHVRGVTIEAGADIPPDLRKALKRDYERFFAAELNAEEQGDPYIPPEINQLLQNAYADITEAFSNSIKREYIGKLGKAFKKHEQEKSGEEKEQTPDDELNKDVQGIVAALRATGGIIPEAEADTGAGSAEDEDDG